MKQINKNQLWVNYPFIFIFVGVCDHCGWNIYRHSYMCWSPVTICCYTCPYPHNHHPIPPNVLPDIRCKCSMYVFYLVYVTFYLKASVI